MIAIPEWFSQLEDYWVRDDQVFAFVCGEEIPIGSPFHDSPTLADVMRVVTAHLDGRQIMTPDEDDS